MLFKNSIAIIDVETTGVDYNKSSVIQLGAVMMDKDGKLTNYRFNTFIKPYTEEWTEEAFKVHKIEKEWVEQNGSDLKLALEVFCKFLSDIYGDIKKNVTIGQWSAGFDVNMLVNAFAKANMTYPFSRRSFDIASIVRFYLALNNQDYNVGLHEAAKKLGVDTSDVTAHIACDDALLTGRCLERVIDSKRTLVTF